MKFKADEIASVIQAEIENYQSQIDLREVGRVLEVGDGIARVYGLSKVMASELVQFSGGPMGMVLNLEEDNVGVAIFGDETRVREGDQARASSAASWTPSGGRSTAARRSKVRNSAPSKSRRPASSTARTSRNPCRRD